MLRLAGSLLTYSLDSERHLSLDCHCLHCLRCDHMVIIKAPNGTSAHRQESSAPGLGKLWATEGEVSSQHYHSDKSKPALWVKFSSSHQINCTSSSSKAG